MSTNSYEIDLNTTPFSRFGSYMSISYLLELKEENAGSFLDIARPAVYKPRPAGIYLQTVHGDALRQEICRFELVRDGESIPFTIEVRPNELKLICDSGSAGICISESNLLMMQTEGVVLRLTGMPGVFDQIIPRGEKRWEYNSLSTRQRFMVSVLEGDIHVDAPYNHLAKKSDRLIIDLHPHNETNRGTGVLEEFATSWIPREYKDSYSVSLENVEREFTAFVEKTVNVPEEFRDTLTQAAYVNWSCVVRPRGILKRPGMFMSKGMMANIWSWDHTFNAMALAYRNPDLAWDQFMIPFDLMDEHGCLPDSVSDLVILKNFTKPPVHGLMLKRMADRTDLLTEVRMSEIYEPLKKWTGWWFAFRNDRGDGLPHYNHGNDSGWDNGTIFDCIHPVSSPDLAAFLVIQMEVLSELAEKLDKPDESSYWAEQAEKLLSNLMNEYLVDSHFVARGAGGEIMDTQSLQLLLPLILGERLPYNVQRSLVQRITQDKFLTPFGLSTESTNSPEYSSNGYWRGPIWAPSTLIVTDALYSVGESDLAKQIARSFCSMCRDQGMAENFDALTGKGLRDRAYTWTSSVFMILAHEFLDS